MSEFAASLPGIHVNFLVILIGAIIVCAIAGAIIGLPTLRLRGDYIAIVTLAFGEIIGRIAQNGDEIKIGDYAFSNGRESISPLDQLNFPFVGEFDSATNLRPYFWAVFALLLVVLFVNLRLRDSRLGRAWIALREDEVAAASMGVPLVKTKLMAYSVGAAFGGISGAFLGVFLNSVNANVFQFGFSIFILAMVILGGLGSIWGVVIGAVLLSYMNSNVIPSLDRGPISDSARRPWPRVHLHAGLVRHLRLHPGGDDGAQTPGHPARAQAPDGAHRGHRRERRDHGGDAA